MMRRVEQTLMLVLAAQIHHHADALRKLTHAGDAAVNFYAAAALGRKAALYGKALRVVRAVEQTRLDAGKRLALAREQIAAGTPILQAASACGFGDYSAFCRAYRRQFGQPPSSAKQDAAETPKSRKKA